MGRHMDVNMRLDTGNIGSIARYFANRAIAGLSRFVG